MKTRLLIFLLLIRGIATAAPIDFESEIQPILAEKCLLCHGPDDKKAGLRLTSIEFASQKLKSGETAIVPGDTENSHVLHRIFSDDPDEIMPPPDKAEPLTDAEKNKLKTWIAEGADWPKHWAYADLRTNPVDSRTNPVDSRTNPVDSQTNPVGSKNIDFLVRKKIDDVIPNFEIQLADPTTLIRRLFYDLIGKPPTIAQLEDHLPRFEKAPVAATERLVDDLLASPHFGERWGRHWLDHARYADSDGYEKDNNRPNAWRYRDWVIDAINADLPFDQFTIEQFAGDLLPNRTEPQLLATAFNRQTLTNTEGGTDREQWRVAAVMDRVETMGAVWLGLTVGCARCHTHKYDEITHAEYYELFAYFNNGDETNSRIDHTPEAVTKWEADVTKKQAAFEEAKAEFDGAKGDLKKRLPRLIADTRAQLAEVNAEVPPNFIPLNVEKFTGPKGVKFTPNKKDNTVLVGGTNAAGGSYFLHGKIPAGTKITGLKIEVLPDKSLPAGGPGRVKHGNFVLNHLKFSVNANPHFFAGAEATHSQTGWPVENALDPNIQPKEKGTGWAIGPHYGKANHAIFGLAQPVAVDREAQFTLELVQNYGDNHMIGKFRVTALTTPTPLVAPKGLRDLLSKNADPAETEIFYAKWDPVLAKFADRVEKAKAAIPARPAMNVRVLTERQNDRRATHIFRRGEFKQPTDAVTPGTLSTLPPIQHRGENGDRLDLARWLVSGENPLPPRVVVNRIWAHLFGEGLVTTINDFGVRGERPSHPELLDWLAAEFIRNGWSRKKLIKTIVMSETYRQSSDHRPELVEIDPKNRLLTRQNRFRVEAEIVRDISLAAAGLLSEKVGGPSVFPPIPPGVTDQNYNSAFKWNVSSGEDRYRRGIYTYFKRTAPHPNLMTFDCPDSNVTSVERTRSNTPLAALITLNNETFTEAAGALARRVLSEKSEADDATRIAHAFRLCLSRAPEKTETDRLTTLLSRARSFYEKDAEAAEKYAANFKVENFSDSEVASWIATVRVILNLDEFLVRS